MRVLLFQVKLNEKCVRNSIYCVHFDCCMEELVVSQTHIITVVVTVYAQLSSSSSLSSIILFFSIYGTNLHTISFIIITNISSYRIPFQHGDNDAYFQLRSDSFVTSALSGHSSTMRYGAGS